MTAVEFLIEQLKGKSNYITWNEIFEQVLKMEKQQIIDAFKEGEDNVDNDGLIIDKSAAEQYYNETFKNK
jgi:hypothetical protein